VGLSSTGARRALEKSQNLDRLALLDELVLAKVIAQAPLPEVLDFLCREIEKQQHDGLICSVCLLDADGVTIRHGAAPSLPSSYNHTIDGAQIGPCAGSCGTALHRGEQVVVEDIASDPLWAAYKELALPLGLRACWSTPIASQQGKLLGTFAVYYREPRRPNAEHLRLVEHATHLAAIAIERDRTHTELLDAETRYRTLVERLPAITYVAEIGPGGAWHYVSPQIETMLGYTPAEWLADPLNWLSHIYEPDREATIAEEKLFEQNRDQLNSEYRMRARDGRLLWFHDEAIMLRQADGQRLVMQGVMYDITERKRLEEELRQSQKMEAVGQLAGGVAHDFNNLLMIIEAHAERLRGRLASADAAHQDAVEISSAVERAAALTRQLLAFSRKQVLQPKLLELNSVLVGVARMLDRVLERKIALAVTTAPALGRVKADPVQLEQVILNLAVNARDAMPNGGTLRLTTANAVVDTSHPRIREGVPSGNYILLTVTDTGIGMDADTRAHMFDPFFTTKPPGKGTGLGLSTVYAAVQQAGGAIWCQSAPGAGTTFEIYLPQADIAGAKGTEQGKAEPTPGTSREALLLVEDQEEIREVVGEFLERRGFTVFRATDGDDALRVAEKCSGSIHLLLTDLMMPNMDGQELARRLKQIRPDTRVLFMSGYPADRLHGSNGNGLKHSILQKPFSLDMLAQTIRAVLDGPDL
jgi:PAS domain S-box-containing protein